MKIAIMGFGTVGSGAYDVAQCAEGIEVVKILDLVVRKGYESIADRFTQNIEDITGDPEIELVIEAMGGVETPRKFVLACLNAGKHVVTPNKNLISACYSELTEAAAENGVQLRYTPAAGGGIPWLYNLLRTRRCDKVTEVRGIVNGTCNYILDAMYENGADFGLMLASAKELGYAEANPAADIEGTDTLRKTVISANLAFGAEVTESDVPCMGIDAISAADITCLREKGLVCRLMMNASCREGIITAYVEPTAFPLTSLEANVKTNNNLITLTAENVGTLSFYGQGAGKLPTGQSVIQDVIDIKDGIGMSIPAAAGCAGFTVNNDLAIHRYYIRTGQMCGEIGELTESYEERDGAFHCMTKPVPVTEMHRLAEELKDKGQPVFFAGLAE